MLFVFPAMRCKVGQTAYLLKRREDIAESLPGQLVFPVGVIFSRNYLSIEKHIHHVFGFCRYEYAGSGKSEYFTTIFAPIIWAYMVLIQIFRIIIFIIHIAAFVFALWVIYQIIIK